jgi:hypothetical protein
MPKRPLIGDVIEIPTAKGLAYAHYTHQHPTHGGLVRVFDALFEVRPAHYAGAKEDADCRRLERHSPDRTHRGRLDSGQ